MRIMLDTNILVSMIFFPSLITRRVAQILSTKHHIVLCDYVIQELRLVTERKFPQKMGALNQFFYELPFQLVYTPGKTNPDSLPSIRDSKDYPILATAILENIDIFITGDKDFLVLNLPSPEILTMHEFLEKYQ